MEDRQILEYGMSTEDIESFKKRNNYDAKPVYPQGLSNGRLVGMHPDIPFLPIDWETEQDWVEMHNEAKKLSKHFVPHRTHEAHSGWSSLCIHGITSVHTESPHTYGYNNDNAPWKWTDVAGVCPTITNFFKTQFDYGVYYRIRIMKVAPGGYVLPHRDTIDLRESHIGPTNLALNNPEGCDFFMDGIGKLPWKQGRAIKLNLYNVHAVYNNSDEDRYHIIIHGRYGHSWENRIFNNYNIWKDIYA
jgi:hypothetical protein